MASSPIVILGMHRSGTSCLTGSFEEAGLSLGEVDTKRHTNPKGNRENLEIMELNNAVLSANGASWDTPPDRICHWSADHIAWRDRLIADRPTDRAWGFKDPRTLLVLDGWLQGLPDARLVGTFRHPVAVAQSLNNRNGFPIETGIKLWTRYNRRLLQVLAQHDMPIVNFDWPPRRYDTVLRALTRHLGLMPPDAGFSFYEKHLRRSENDRDIPLPDATRRIYDRLHQQGRKLAQSVGLPVTRQSAPLHSTRLFPTRGGADAYALTGIAARCDWALLSDTKPPMIHLERTRPTDAPRHIFVSLRNPFGALAHFATKVLPTLHAPFVLITGSQDCTLPQQTDHRWRPFDTSERRMIAAILDHPLVIHWFAENLDDDSDPRLSALPTGMVYPEGASQGSPAPSAPLLRDRPQRVLCGHRFRDGPQWHLRRTVSDLARTAWADFCTTPQGELPEADYIALIQSHSFVMCVEGGGLDPSPKAWQAILNGAIPIIRRNGTTGAYADLPVAIVDEWHPDSLSPARLADWHRDLAPFYDRPELRTRTLERLGLEYWWTRIAQQARDASSDTQT